MMALALFVASAAWPFACHAGTTVEEIAAVVRLSDAVVVVTGADGRSGAQIALAAAMTNATVVLHGRNATKIAAAVSQIRAGIPMAKLHSAIFDLGSLNKTAEGAAALLQAFPRIDILVNNAGGIDQAVTSDGFVGTFQVNALAPALLARALAPALAQAPAPRVIYVASASNYDGVTKGAWPAKRTAADFLGYARAKPAVPLIAAYGISKLLIVWYVQVLQGRELAASASKVTTAHISVNPGFFRAPPFTPDQKAECREAMHFSPCPQLPAQGAASTAFAALVPGAEAAAGRMLDFETDVDKVAGKWVQSGETCVPRPLPEWDEAEAEKWYSSVQSIIDQYV